MQNKIKKIELLTKEEEARFPEFIEKWIKIGLCTEPANRKLAEEGIIEAYQIAGLPPPKVVWCGSPLSQGLTRAIVRTLKLDIGKNVWDSVGASVGDSVGDSVADSVGDSVAASVWASIYGQHDANWLAIYDFFKEVSGLKSETEKLAGLWKISQNAGWFLPHEKICWISERHTFLSQDDNKRLHNESQMAVQYPDGWGIFAWHGIRIPLGKGWIITNPEKITIKLIDKEENAEIKRVMIERFGMAEYLKQTKAKLIDESIEQATGNIRQLYQTELITGSDALFLKLINSSPEPDGTKKEYIIPVHPECRPIFPDDSLGGRQELTALNAVASSFGLYGHEYCPQIET